jgi:hypothetical protein
MLSFDTLLFHFSTPSFSLSTTDIRRCKVSPLGHSLRLRLLLQHALDLTVHEILNSSKWNNYKYQLASLLNIKQLIGNDSNNEYPLLSIAGLPLNKQTISFSSASLSAVGMHGQSQSQS